MEMRVFTFMFGVLVSGLADLHAQVGSGSITGILEDATGARVAGGSVRVIGEGRGSEVAVEANREGAYRVDSLLPGRYSVTATAAGFEAARREGVVLTTSQVLAVDFRLIVGRLGETVMVTEAAPLAETQSSSLAQVVGHEYIDNLPLPNRSANSLVALSPGVVVVDPGQGAENYPVFSVAGGRVRNQMFTLDGGSIGNAVGLTRPQQVASLPLDALEEFRVISNNYAAEYGHSTGGIIALTTRSGTNHVHGSLFEYLRNDALDARNFFAKTKPPLRLNQFGAALGGPIRRDKTHFFASWEQTRQTNSDTVRTTVPTLDEREGNFSALPAQIYDPATKQPFPGNRIPASAIDPVARAASAYWPAPNLPGLANNFLGSNTTVLSRNIVVGKLDHSFGEHDRATARYYINDATTASGGSFGISVADPLAVQSDVRIQSVAASYLHTFSPTLLNQFEASFMQRKFIQGRAGAGQDYAAKLGLAGVDGAAFPTFNVTGYGLLGSQGVANSSILRVQTPIRDTQLQDAVSKYAGRHALKAGVEYRFGENNESNNLSSSGNLVFNRQITDKVGASGTTGDAYASFLLGLANSASLNKTDTILSRASYWAAYVQDDFRVTSKLTVNAGLRWESELPRQVDGNKLNGFDPLAINPVSGTPGIVTFAGQNEVPNTSFDANYRNFGPRLGFAYSGPGALVIRGGAGIFYGPNVSNSVTTSATLGYSDSFSVSTSAAETNYALALKNGFPAYTRPQAGSPGFGAAAPGQKAFTSVQFFDRHRPTPVSYQYNFDLQKEVLPNLLVEAGYLGNVSHHLTGNDLTLNQVPIQLAIAGDTQRLRPFPQFTNVTSVNPAIGNSTYHAVFVKTERRFTNGVAFLAHYTFSKFLDDVASGDEFGDPGSYQDQYNRKLDKGRSGSDVPHRFLFTGLYQAKRLGGVELGVEATFQSGQVFTVYDATNSTNAFPAGTTRPNLVGNLSDGASGTLGRYFNTGAFAHPASFQFGNSPRSVGRGPGSEVVDFSAAKQFVVREGVKLEFRAALFNVFNFANFDIPGHTLGNSDFGIISVAKPARTVQVAGRLLF